MSTTLKQTRMFPFPLGYGKKAKNFELSKLEDTFFFVDLKIPSLIAGPIKPYKYFPVACMILQIIFKLGFSQYPCLCQIFAE